jgi:hypothetical protein
MKKDFLKMTPAQRDAEAKKWRKGISFDQTTPMTKRSKALWALAKRGRGRPRKPESEKSKRTIISIEPRLLALADAFATSKGLDRSKLFALSVQEYIASDGSR